jgi:cytochrome b involved in lipid metabolism
MTTKTIAALGLSLVLLLGGCAQGAEPEAGQDPAVVETQDSSYGEMSADPEMEAPTEQLNESEPEEAAESEAEDSAQASASTSTASPTASPSPTATRSATAAPSATASPTASPTETQAPSPEPGFTLAEVATRNTASNCWVAISGNVYDLTRWITQHPGGAGAITQLCGKDATSQFLGQHGGQSRPVSTLAGYLIGPLRN